MNIKILCIGAVLELGYLIHLVITNIPMFNISPMFVELTKHFLFQVVVLTLFLVGAFLNGKKK